MENKKLRRQIEDKDRAIDELKASVVEKTGFAINLFFLKRISNCVVPYDLESHLTEKIYE